MSRIRCISSTMDKSLVLAPLFEAQSQQATDAPDENSIVIDPRRTGQPMLGFGANWTDTDVYNLFRMSETEQDRVLEALFDTERGAGWSFMRVPFASTDWERNMDFYSYDDMPEGQCDWELAHFSVQRDIDRGFFDLLRKIRDRYPHVALLASVWAVPGWMKSNDSLLGGIFRTECAQVYAKYLRMAVQAFAQQGVELYSITTQNEPKSSDFPNNNRGTPATRFTWRQQREVLLALRGEFDAHGIKTRIWAYDHNFDMVETFVDPLLADEQARAAIDGVAFHPYRGDPAVMGRIGAQYPDMPLYSTEKSVFDPKGMDELLRQLRYGARCYIHWSFIEDTHGGPHQLIGTPFQYQGARTSSLSIVSSHPLRGDQWSLSGTYGLFAQFSRFIRRGMKRIDSTYGHARWITTVAFSDEQGNIVLVAVNQTGTEQSFTLRCGSRALGCHVPAMSVSTFLLDADSALADGSVTLSDAPAKQFYEPPTWDLEPGQPFFAQNARAGEEIRFQVTLTNVGNAPTLPNTTAGIDILLDGDLRIARIASTVPVLAPGESITLTANVPVYDVSGTGCKTTWTATGGWHDFMALLNVGNCYPNEKNQYNNRSCCELYFEDNTAQA